MTRLLLLLLVPGPITGTVSVLTVANEAAGAAGASKAHSAKYRVFVL